MQRKSVVTILMHMLKELADGNGDKEYRNPDFVFSEMDDNGSFDNLSGRQFSEMELLTIGCINDMYCEMQRDEEPHAQIASQDNSDRF